jgi:NTP pyrophosphatase (non-canonical NTP hydrolase)
MINYNKLNEAIDLLIKERERQDKKWNDPPDWLNNDLATRLAVLGEEHGEVSKAILEHGEMSEETLLELVQVAAVAVKWMESILVRMDKIDDEWRDSLTLGVDR